MGLVGTLAVILISAGVFTIVSRALKQPLILGYIVAGFIVSPHLGLFPGLSMENVKEWSDIGIIFLLFALGLEFSFKKLIKVGSSALLTAGTKCIGMFVVGLIVGQAMSWTMMESIFLGGLLSMSSTTIIIKAYDDMGLKNKPWATLVFGSLVVEDLIAVLLLVLLSTLAVSQKFAGGEMLLSMGKLAFFIILWFLVGIYVIPTLLRKAHRYLSDEILLLVSIGLCFSMVVMAEAVGFSSALGAFVMGSILAETLEAERIEHNIVPIKDLFGAIFFVSVGMMIDPAVIAEHWLPVIIITIAAMGGIVLFSTTGVLLSAQGLNTAIHTSFSLAQLGEFAFIIAGLGCSLGVMREFIYPVIIAVSVITTFTTPYMIKVAEPVSSFLYAHLPVKVLAWLDAGTTSKKNAPTAEIGEWRKLLQHYFIRIVAYSVILVAIYVGSHFIKDLIIRLVPTMSEIWVKLSTVGITLVIMSPFLYGLTAYSPTMRESVGKLLSESESNKYSILALVFLRIFLAVMFVILLIVGHFELSYWALLLIFAGAFMFFVSARRSVGRLPKLEMRFMKNLNEKELVEKLRKPVTSSVNDKLSDYDVKLEQVVISPDSLLAGKKLREMPFRHTTGVNIVKIERGKRSILIPSGDELLFPGDRVLAVGTAAQTEAFRKVMESELHTVEETVNSPFSLEAYILGETSYLTGKTLRSVAMRSAGCMVISVIRGQEVITNPKPDFRFQKGDTVWMAGDKASCEWYAR